MLKQKTVYFREEDLPLWESIPNKAEWLHDKLAGVSVSGGKQQPATLEEQAITAFSTAKVPTKGRYGLNDTGEVFGPVSLEKCPGHTMRMNCGLEGCKYT